MRLKRVGFGTWPSQFASSQLQWVVDLLRSRDVGWVQIGRRTWHLAPIGMGAIYLSEFGWWVIDADVSLVYKPRMISAFPRPMTKVDSRGIAVGPGDMRVR